MTEIFSLVIVFCFMGGLYYFVLRGATREGRAQNFLKSVGRGQGPGPIKDKQLSDFIYFASGILVALSLLSLGVTTSGTSAIVVGAGIAVVSAVAAFGGSAIRLAVHAFYGLIGGAGVLKAIYEFIVLSEGGLEDSWRRVLAFLLVFIFFVFGALIAFVKGKLSVISALGVYGALEVLIFLASPLGTQLLNEPLRLLLSLVGGALIGFCAGLQPEWAVIFTTIVVSFALLAAWIYGVDASTATTTTVGPGDRVLILVGYLAPFVLIWWVGDRVRTVAGSQR